MRDTLTAEELANIWNSYLSNSMAVNMTFYLMKTATDQDVVDLLKDALELAEYQFEGAKNLFNQFNHPHPQGFAAEEFDFNAPALYKDNLILLVKYILSQDAASMYAVALSTATHPDVRQYYLTSSTRTSKLIQQLVEMLEKKGLFQPKINLPVPDSIEKVQKQSFMGNWLSGKRPLNAVDIIQITTNLTSLKVIKEFLRSFIQITTSEQLKEHYKRGEKIAQKHIDFLQSLLTDYNLPQKPSWENEITDSTVKPFSERMMLYKISVFVASTVGRYGTALSAITRKDIGLDLSRLMGEFALYGEDTSNLMIEEGFLDQLPLAKDLDQ